MICHIKDDEIALDDINLFNFDDSSDLMENLVSVNYALALSICKIRNLPSCVFVLSLLYMKRLRSVHSLSLLTQINNLTKEELCLISTLLADKYLIDEGEGEELFNSDLLELTGIPLERINLIERQVLSALNWNLFVSDDEFKEFFSLFKNQMVNKNIDESNIDYKLDFHSVCFKFIFHAIEYFLLTSLLLIGASLFVFITTHMTTSRNSTSLKTSINYAGIPSPCKISANSDVENDSSPTKSPWFWPLLSICLVLIVGIPCTLFVFIFICHRKYKLNDDSDESSIDSNASSSSSAPTVPDQNERRRRAARHLRSHYVSGFRTPPPPYTSNNQPSNLFVTASPPPPYDSHVEDNTLVNSSTIISVPQPVPIENSITRSLDVSETSSITIPSSEHIENSSANTRNNSSTTIVNVIPTQIIGLPQTTTPIYSSSSTVTNQSIQTFDA